MCFKSSSNLANLHGISVSVKYLMTGREHSRDNTVRNTRAPSLRQSRVGSDIDTSHRLLASHGVVWD